VAGRLDSYLDTRYLGTQELWGGGFHILEDPKNKRLLVSSHPVQEYVCRHTYGVQCLVLCLPRRGHGRTLYLLRPFQGGGVLQEQVGHT
jgi:hypothetical protein